MALRLDHLLEPGERVIWRGRGSRWAGLAAVLPRFALIAGFILVVWLLPRLGADTLSLQPPSPQALYLLSFALFLMASFILAGGVSVQREAALTERRVIKLSGLFWPRVSELPLGEVVRLRITGALGPSGLAVEGGAGRDLRLEQVVAPRELLGSLAQRTGLALAPAAPPGAPLAGHLLATAGRWGAGLGLLAVAGLLFAGGRTGGVLPGVGVITWAALAAGAVLLARLLASLAALTYLRRFVSPAELRAAIHGPIEGAGPALGRRFGRRTRWTLARLAALVYGEAMGAGDTLGDGQGG